MSLTAVATQDLNTVRLVSAVSLRSPPSCFSSFRVPQSYSSDVGTLGDKGWQGFTADLVRTADRVARQLFHVCGRFPVFASWNHKIDAVGRVSATSGRRRT